MSAEEKLNALPATCSVKEVSDILGISTKKIYEQINAGTFPVRSIKIGETHRVITASLKELVCP